MIQIVARQVIKPECIDTYHKIVAELVEKSNAEEGNVSYRNLQSLSDERVHVFLEVWKDQNAIDIHNASEHFTRIFPQLCEMLDGEDAQQVDLYQYD